MKEKDFKELVKVLKETGYDHFIQQWETHADKDAYQKRVKDINGKTKYFISIYSYKKPYTLEIGVEVQVNFSVNALELEEEHPTIWVTLPFTSLEVVEKLVDALWVAHGSWYYEN